MSKVEKQFDGENLTPLAAIRMKCRDCTGGSLKEIRNCQTFDCSLHPFRMGRNPQRSGIGNRRVVPPRKRELTGEKPTESHPSVEREPWKAPGQAE